MKKWIGLMALAAAAQSVWGVSLYEPFNYTPAAPLDGQIAPDGKQWFYAGPATTSFPGTIGSTSLSYTGLPASQGNDMLYGESSTGSSERIDVGGFASGTVYWSMLYQANSLTDLTQQFVAGFNNLIGAQTTVVGTVGDRLTLKKDATVTTDFDLGINGNAGTAVFAPTPEPINTTFFVVGAYVFNDPVASSHATSNDVMDLWVDPNMATFSTSTPPTITVSTTGKDLTTAGSYEIESFVYYTTNTIPLHQTVDELHVGNSWGSVTPVEWTASSSSSTWSTAANWSGGAVPGGAGSGADLTFGANSTVQNVTLDTPEEIGTLRFNGTNNYTIGGSSTLTFNTPTNGALNVSTSPTDSAYVAGAADPAQIVVSATSSVTHTISAPIYLNRSIALTVPTGSTLNLTNVSANVTTTTGVWLSLTGGGSVAITPASATAFSNASGQGLAGLDITGNLKFTPAHALILLNIAGPTVASSNLMSTATYPNPVSAFNLSSGSTLDLTNNDLIVNRNPGDGSTETAILNAVEHAYDNGKWDQTGITSSAAASTTGTTLAYVDNALLNVPLTTVDGEAVGNDSIIVKYTWYGDLNLDGVVNYADSQLMFDGDPSWAGGDLNYDGFFNADDWSLFFLGSAESNGASIGSVPEPGAITLLATLGLLGIRRRRHI